ncbi:hypothetical protein ABBQ32_003472 [Trebouxia sp. C0010 RCD-2024]
MAKRYSRGLRYIDNDTHLGGPNKRDSLFGQPRVPLVAAAFLIFLAGILVGTRVGHSGTQVVQYNQDLSSADGDSAASTEPVPDDNEATRRLQAREAQRLQAREAQGSNNMTEKKFQGFAWSVKMVEKTICDDSCHKARDGKCDDGSTMEEDQVFCDLGTDCQDCGNWTTKVPADQADDDNLPIDFLHSRQIDIFVKETTSVPSFQMAYTDPAKDVDVSAQMEYGGIVEMGLTQMWSLALKDHCIRHDGKRALVLDVGANFGWYSMYAAKLGCRVIAWEPVPQFRAFLMYNRQLNHFEDRIEIRDAAVMNIGGMVYNITVPQRGIWGTAGIGGLNIDRAIDNRGDYEIVYALGERVDMVVEEEVLLLKVDVEGLEPAVMHSSTRLLDKHKVHHIVMEYSPGPWETGFRWKDYGDLPQMLGNLLARNYTILHVPDSLARGALLQLPDWTGHTPAFQEVTQENMQYDLADVQLLLRGRLGCPKPPQLMQLNELWTPCSSIPEDLHPRSFRATFGHNTNIWVMQGNNTFQVGSPVGVMGLQQDTKEWYGRHPLLLGMGYRLCQDLDPTIQVGSRLRFAS